MELSIKSLSLSTLAPIVLFVYNRPWHTKQTVEALQKNELAKESELFIFSDGAKNEDVQSGVSEVRNYISEVSGFKKIVIIKREENWGLSRSVIDGVTKIVKEYGRIIVLEDDLVTSPYFLKFMNNGLEYYKSEEKVASIHGYIYPIDNLPSSFFIRGADCWGWATWKDKWIIFEPDGQKLLNELKSKKLEKYANFNNSYDYTKMLKRQIKGKNESWAVRWYMSALLKEMLTLYPGKSYVQNIGNDESGTHCNSTDQFEVKLSGGGSDIIDVIDVIDVMEDLESRDKIELYFNSIKHSPIQAIKAIIKRAVF